MSNAEAIKITADVTDLQVKRAIFSSEMKAANKDLNDFAKTARTAGLTDELRASMMASAEAAQAARNEIAALNAKIGEQSAVVERASFSIREMGGHIRESVAIVGEFREALVAFGEATIAAFAIERIGEFAEKMGENAEQVKHLSETFGMTVPQIQGLQGAAAATGIAFDSISKAMGIFDKNLVNANASNVVAAQAFKALGLSARDGKSQMELLLEVAEKFKNMDDGPRKVALAMQLFGKSGKDMIPFLDQGRAGIEELDRKTQDYGAGVLVATDANKALREWLDQVNERGVALAESINEQKLGWQGVSNVMTDAFAPVLTEIEDGMNSLIKAFIDSYREGGSVAAAFDIVAGAAEALHVVISALWEIFETLWEVVSEVITDIMEIAQQAFGSKIPENVSTTRAAFNALLDLLIVLKDGFVISLLSIKATAEEAFGTIRVLIKVTEDAFRLDWGAIKADWHNGLAGVESEVRATSNRIIAATQEMKTAFMAAGLGQAMPSHGEKGVPSTRAGGDFEPPLPTGRQKKKKDDLVQRLQEELDAKKVAWAMEQDAQGTAQAYSLQSEADYWKQFLARTDLSVKDRLAIEQKYLAAHGQLTKQKLAAEEDVFKQEITAANRDADAKLAIAEKELAWVKTKYGERSDEYRAMQDKIVQLTREAASQREQIEADHEKTLEQIALGQIDAQQAAAQHRVAMGRETSAQLIAQERQFEEQKWAIEKAALIREAALATANNDPAKAAQLHNQLLVAEQQYQNKLTQIVQQAELQRTRYQRQGIQGVSSAFGQSIGQMLTLQKTFADGVKGIFQGIQQTIGNILGDIIQQWLEQQLTALIIGKTQQGVTGVAQVTSNAAVAASGAYAATAAIPIVGPELAPAAAATALAGAMSFAPLAAFAQGTNNVPADMIAQIHAGERIIPAADNRALMEALNDNERLQPRARFNSGGNGGGSGDHHWHYHDHTGTATPDQIERNHRAVGKAWKRAYREGHFAGMKI